MTATTTVYDPATKSTTAQPATTGLAAPKPSTEIVRLSMDTVAGFEALQRAARLLAASSLVPERYRGADGLPNAVIALEMATRIGASPLMAMQHLYVVHGSPSWSAQFLIAAVNSSGRFSALRYETKGTPGQDGYQIRAWAVERDTNERLNGAWVTWDMVRAEGWLSKNGSKWRTMPEQMGMYRAAAFWQRAYAPEISMGLRTKEELEDSIIDVTPVELPAQPAGEPGPAPAQDPAAAQPAEDPAPKRGTAAVKAALRKEQEPAEKPASEPEQRPLTVQDEVTGESFQVGGKRG